MKHQSKFLSSTLVIAAMLVPSAAFGQVPVFSGLFGSRDLEIDNPNNPGSTYEMFFHENDPGFYEDELAYNADRGSGFVVQYEDPFDSPFGERNGSGIFGPFDDSPNGRENFESDEIYNSFIGFKSYSQACNADLFDDEDRNGVCSEQIEPEGGIFRVDVPNGTYRFVGVFGDSQHNHAHRVVVEDGGEGLAGEYGDNHAVLIGNHNQPDYVGYVLSDEFPGSDLSVGRNGLEGGNLAVVGFDDKLPPMPEGDVDQQPLFVSYDENGLPVLDENGAPIGLAPGVPSSPTLEVTQGFVRLHLLQGNSNPFFDEETDLEYPADANGSDMILFEIIPASGSLTGDFDGSGALDVGDLDAMATGMMMNDLAFDLNGDGTTNIDDRLSWIKDLKNTWVGDANLDGEFNSGDFVAVFQAGKFETGSPATWGEGDWDGDKVFSSGDFVAAFQDGGFELGPRMATNSVPEPSSIALLLLGVLGLASRARNR